MRRPLLRLLGLSAVAALSVPPIAAALVKSRGDRPSVADFEPLADEIDLAAIFEGFELKSQAPSFRGGDMLLWYGGGVLDLREATLDPAGGKLTVRSIFGGMQLVIPASWPVRVHSRGIFGGVGSEATSAPETGPALEIDALSIFGGIGITIRGPSDDETAAGEPADERALDLDPETAGA
jgi:hypothetical protein